MNTQPNVTDQPPHRRTVPKALLSDAVAAANRAEAAQPQAFFDDFAQAVTVYRDDAVWVVDKPAGLLSVDGKDLKVSMQARLLKADPSVKLVHRLDMDTSGLLIFARCSAAQTHLAKQFIARVPQKCYQALVFGTLMGQGSVDAPVRYEPTLKPKHIVDNDWHKPALTHYTALHHELRQGQPITRVALEPVTGRSHQLRVHMLHLGHVMLGDPIYAEGAALSLAPRLCLHAHTLALNHPDTGAWMAWASPVPF